MTQLTQAQGHSSREKDFMIDKMNGHETMDLLVLCEAH